MNSKSIVKFMIYVTGLFLVICGLSFKMGTNIKTIHISSVSFY